MTTEKRKIEKENTNEIKVDYMVYRKKDAFIS
jgi:hypothetical protein